MDDDALNLFVLENYLEPFNFQIKKSRNGAEAVKLVEDELINRNLQISLILMDCNMPIMNGFLATENIQNLLKKTGFQRIPIIGVTANDIEFESENALAAGMDKLIMKPVKQEDLHKIVKKLIPI